jgi:hypothetical protein
MAIASFQTNLDIGNLFVGSMIELGGARKLPAFYSIKPQSISWNVKFSYVVLHTYLDEVRQPQDEVVIHAMCAELWRGGEPIALTQPQHTFGLPPRMVKEYAKQLLEALYQEYGKGRRSGFERFAREEQHSVAQCPIRPCSFHAEHLHSQPWGGKR